MSTTPQSDPQAMPLADLKQAAGLNDPQPQTPPATPAAPAAPPAPVVPEKYTISKDDNGVTITLSPEYGGEVYKGKDLDEAVTKLAGSKADANAYIKQLKSQPQQPAPVTPKVEPPPVDPQVQATRDWLIAEQAAAMGMSAEEYKARVSMVFQTTEQMQTNIAIADFHKLCPDYVDTPENSKIIGDYFPENFGRFPSAGELKQAYALAVYEGKIKPQPATPATPRPPVMPTAGSTPPGSGDQSAWTMPLDELKKQAGLG
jgi:hypothetical protein